MSKQFPHIMSPVRIGNTVVKNRLLHPNASPHFMQGPETFPAESLMAHYSGLAKAGAGIVTIAEWDNYPGQRNLGGKAEDSRHMQAFDLTDPSVHNYICALVEEVHFYGAKLIICANPELPKGYSLHGGLAPMGPAGNGGTLEPLPKEMIPEIIQKFVNKIKLYRSFGYDGLSVRLDTWVSRGEQQRQDEFGGSVENRTRFIRMVLEKVRETFGPDFIIEGTLHGEQPLGYYGGIRPGEGYEFWEVLEFAKLIDGVVDILQLREKDGARAHPLPFNFKKGEHETIRYARDMKKAGVKMLLCPGGGFQDPEEIEGYLASGDCDMIAVARAFIADPEYGTKIFEDRAEDITPCLWCNRCHGNFQPPWVSVCAVNPRLGLEHKLHRMLSPVKKKKVAVIGGGPAGMRAAIFAAQRGHEVVLFEKTDYLGGQLWFSEYFSFKWSILDYKNWLVAQMEKAGVEIRMNTAPTPEEITAEGFDAVLAATGATPKLPDSIKGLKDEKGKALYPTCYDVFGKGKELGKHVIIVGGSETGVETGMYLAESGHDVTILTRQGQLAHDASQLHYITFAYLAVGSNGRTRLASAWEKYDNLRGILNVTTKSVQGNTVTYVDKEGTEHTVTGDSVVICGGTIPNLDSAMEYATCTEQFYPIGNCNGADGIWRCNTDAFSKASIL